MNAADISRRNRILFGIDRARELSMQRSKDPFGVVAERAQASAGGQIKFVNTMSKFIALGRMIRK